MSSIPPFFQWYDLRFKNILMWYDPLELPIAFLIRYFYMILNQQKIFNKVVHNMTLLIQFGG